MAKRRTKALNEADRVVLQNLEKSYPGSLAYAEKEGKIDPRVQEFFNKMAKSDPEGAQKQLDRYTLLAKQVGLKYTKQELDEFLKQTEKEAGLTPEELEDRLEAFQEIGKKTMQGGLDKNRLEKTVYDALSQYENESVAKQHTAEIVEHYLSGKLPSGAEIQSIIGGKLSEDTVKWFDQFGSVVGGSEFRKEVPIEVSSDISRLQERIGTLKTQAERDAAINDYLAQLPENLRQSREQFLSGEEQRAMSALERQVPAVLQDLNIRGMLQSGEVEDELTTRALNLESSLEDMQTELEAEDNQFYYDAAFQNSLRNELSKVEDYRSALAQHRQNVLTERERGFKSRQSELDIQLNEDLARSGYARNAALQRQKLQREREQTQEQNRLNVVSKIAETGANIATNVALKSIG